MADFKKYRRLYSNLKELHKANLNAVIFDKNNRETYKNKFLSVQRFNDLSVTMQIARMNLSRSIKEKCEWEQYVFALNALLWYNICDDYICQYFYLREHSEEITDQNYFQFLQDLRYEKLRDLRNHHPCLLKLNSDLSSLHDCVNIIKHRMPILDRSKQNQSIGFGGIRLNSNSPTGFSFDKDSVLSTNVAKEKSYTIENLLDILINTDNLLTTFVNENISAQFY